MTTSDPSRRAVLAGAAAVASAALAPAVFAASPRPLFQISLAQWSLHRTIRSGELDALDFPAFARSEFGIGAVEYVNQFFADKATDFAWLRQLRMRAADAGSKSLLIMIDGVGRLATLDDAARRAAVEGHHPWIAAAAFLGCHAIRVNAAGDKGAERDAMADRAADSLRRLADFGAPYGISVIVENHGGPSSDGAWLADVMRRAAHPGVGTLPDFGNFRVDDGVWYDRYQGMADLMPYAKAVSAKSHDFDADGNETNTDYRRVLKTVVDAGYTGFVGIEYEGQGHGEVDGIRLTQRLLERVRAELSAG